MKPWNIIYILELPRDRCLWGFYRDGIYLTVMNDLREGQTISLPSPSAAYRVHVTPSADSWHLRRREYEI